MYNINNNKDIKIISNSRSIDLLFRERTLCKKAKRNIYSLQLKLKYSPPIFIEKIVSGDYEWTLNFFEENENNKYLPCYWLSLKTKGKSFHGSEQFEKSDYEFGKRKLFNRNEVKNKILEWLNEYGDLGIQCYNTERIEKYVKLFNACGFKLDRINSTEFIIKSN